MGNGERDAKPLVDKGCPVLPGIQHLRRIVPWPGHHANNHLADRVYAEGEGGGDPEVPAATAALDTDEVVAGESKLAREKTAATAESQASDANARAGPPGDRDPMLPQATIAIEQANPGADDRFAARHVDVDVGQSTHVDHETAVDHGVRFIAMPT